jgi:hypothetical protein
MKKTTTHRKFWLEVLVLTVGIALGVEVALPMWNDAQLPASMMNSAYGALPTMHAAASESSSSSAQSHCRIVTGSAEHIAMVAQRLAKHHIAVCR